MPLTAAQAEENLDAWIACDLALTKNQSYTVGHRTYTRTDAKEVTAKINFWRRQVSNLSRSGRRTTQVIPLG